jgi:hypothetical protein
MTRGLRLYTPSAVWHAMLLMDRFIFGVIPMRWVDAVSIEGGSPTCAPMQAACPHKSLYSVQIARGSIKLCAVFQNASWCIYGVGPAVGPARGQLSQREASTEYVPRVGQCRFGLRHVSRSRLSSGWSLQGRGQYINERVLAREPV